MFSDETGEIFAANPQDPRLRFPLYKARIDPDLHFIGFDLTLDEVRGDPRLDETAEAHAMVGDNIGWFFVIQEAVGEPRFGLDVEVPVEPLPREMGQPCLGKSGFVGRTGRRCVQAIRVAAGRR